MFLITFDYEIIDNNAYVWQLCLIGKMIGDQIFDEEYLEQY